MPPPFEPSPSFSGRFEAATGRGPALSLLLTLASVACLATSCNGHDAVLADDARRSVDSGMEPGATATERQGGLAAERRQSKLIAEDWGTGASLASCPTSTPELGLWQALRQRSESELDLVRGRYAVLSPHLKQLTKGVDEDERFAKLIVRLLASEGGEFEALLDSDELANSRARMLGCCWDLLLLRRIMRLGIGAEFQVEQVEALAFALNRNLAQELIRNPDPQLAQRLQSEIVRPAAYLDTLGTCMSPLVEALLQLEAGAVRSRLAQVLIDHIEAYRMTGIVPRLDADKVNCVFNTMPGPLREHYSKQSARDRLAKILRYERALAEGANQRNSKQSDQLPATGGKQPRLRVAR